MCLAIPMQIAAIDGHVARCTAKGVVREVNLLLLEEVPAVNDHVLVHAGHAVQTLTEQEAAATWLLLDEILALEAAAARRGVG